MCRAVRIEGSVCVCARVCVCLRVFSLLEDVKGFAAGCSLRILDFVELWAVSTTHTHNPFCTVGLYQEKKTQLDGGGADKRNLLETHTHTHTHKREE